MRLSTPLFLVITSSVLIACGGGSSSTSSTSGTTTSSLAATYPEGVAGTSPTSVSDSSGAVVAQLPLNRRIKDWGLAFVELVRNQDLNSLKRLAFLTIPMDNAWAAPARVPEASTVGDFISRVAAGTAIPTRTNLDLNAFFVDYTRANCYGPEVRYTNHAQNGSSGTLPTGDTGMWLAREGDQTTGVPCSAAQFRALMEPVKKRINSTLIFGARMRALAGTSMPASGSSLDLTSAVNTFYQTLLPTGVTGSVSSASISNSAGTYTYTVIANGSASAGGGITVTKKIVVKVVHNGTSPTFNGLASYATYSSHTNTGGANVCTPLGGTANAGKKIDVGTVRYSKASATEMNVSAREALYCLNGTDSALTATLSDYVALTTAGELDQTKTACTNSCIGADAKGWIQEGTGFKRFGATYEPSTYDGNYKFAWQAGVGDSHSRMFAMNMSYNSVTQVRTGQAFFGFSGAFNPQSTDSTNSNLKGMICNWAGPGNTQNPNNYFQYQRITLTASATDWDISSAANSNLIYYAPTNSCAVSGGMNFDVNANGTVAAGEGATVTNGLDTLDSGRASVQATIEGRGFINPTLY